MGPEWELLAAAAAAHAKDEAQQKKQRMKQIKNKKLEDKSKIQKVLLEDDEGPILIQVAIIHIPRHHMRLNGDELIEEVD